MAFFQNAVLNKYLAGLEEKKVDIAWEQFTSHFHDPEVQENIRSLKEEEYQEGFLDDLFVKVLGYVKNPTPGFNLRTEQKNEGDAKKADGALLDGEKVKAVIELKGTDTTDLGKVEPQAFGYKNKQKDATYVIISNFEKLRFYIDNAVNHLEFNLFLLTKKEFKLLWLCLSYESFSRGIPKKIKEASVTEEENVTKKLYKDYSDFKHDIFEDIVANNPGNDKLLLFRKTQKLLDRFLFIFFAEDRNLLPPNSIREIITQWMDLRDKYDEYVPLYERFKKYFGYMNEGHKGKKHEIFAYNGGLFAADELLDGLKIGDEVLYKHALTLSHYDFESEVDVNILGHIFEHSLNEIEVITAELEGKEVDTTKTKRKKDGVFYTPKYITKYIVEQTVGKLCEEKKAEFNISDERYTEAGRRTKKGIEDLKKYREWLLSLTICDPACGSGAFLNQALEFLIAEHAYLDELTAKYHNSPLVLSDIENTILEKNLFGVDINDEAVEIAKLSLWLRTAQPGRKLTSLNNNIKCGNSLIDDPEVAGEKAFNWQNEFPEIFDNGGFDVVIGNPPYITFALGAKQKHDDLITKYLKENFPKSSVYKVSSYLIFIEVGLHLLNSDGMLSYIIPNTFHTNYYYKDFRENLIDSFGIDRILDVRFKVFADAEMGYTSIPFFTRRKDLNTLTKISRLDSPDSLSTIGFFEIKQDDFKSFPDSKFLFQKPLMKVWNKAKQGSDYLGEKRLFTFYNGTKTGNNSKFLVDQKNSDLCKPVLRGKDFYRYLVQPYEKFIIFDKDNLWSNTNDEHFLVDSKLLIRRTSDHLAVAYDANQIYVLDTVHLLYSISNNYKNSYLLALLNSKVFQLLYKILVPEGGKAFAEVKIANLKNLPIKRCEVLKQEEIGGYSLALQRLNISLFALSNSFIKLLLSKYEIEKASKNLQSWHELNFKEFLNELKKQKISLSLAEQAEWMDYFNQHKVKAEELKAQIDQTDKEIDHMVYELYGLTEDEIAIVEENVR